MAPKSNGLPASLTLQIWRQKSNGLPVPLSARFQGCAANEKYFNIRVQILRRSTTSFSVSLGDMSGIPKPDGPDINIGGPMMRTIWVLTGISILVVGLRLYAQFISRHLDLGDAIMTLSMVCAEPLLPCYFLTGIDLRNNVVLDAYNTASLWTGTAFLLSFVDPEDSCHQVQFPWASLWYNGACVWTYGIMSPDVEALRHKAETKTAPVVYLLGVTGGECHHIDLGLCAVQGRSVIVGRCRTSTSMLESQGSGALNSATDLALTILPATIFWTLQINMRMKLGLGFLLSLSIFAFIACIIKTVLLQSLGEREDFTFNTVPFFTWVIAEITLVNIAASVPLIRPLFKRPSTHAGNTSYEMKNQYASTNKGSRLRSRDVESGRHSILDNTSEENILPIEGVTVAGGGHDRDVEVDKNGIMLSTSYVVSYDENGKEDSMPGKKGQGLPGGRTH
ncbi:uncharacterized protein PAC_19981 [Phialocephala subalpina]|uniref:Rhodopsin domain-containing protein n=1 Tax=Phialocephala subalpina TaxID=576137 RepID=A0A1L7XYJ6_9HELO|nr:uncharacterized protein PAC_19981 [Phialocephala subalpina]